MKCEENKLDANIVAEKNVTVIYIRKHTWFDNQLKEVVIPSHRYIEYLFYIYICVPSSTTVLHVRTHVRTSE